MTTIKTEAATAAEQLENTCKVTARPHTSPAEGFQEPAHESHHPLPESSHHQANHSSEEIKAVSIHHISPYLA